MDHVTDTLLGSAQLKLKTLPSIFTWGVSTNQKNPANRARSTYTVCIRRDPVEHNEVKGFGVGKQGWAEGDSCDDDQEDKHRNRGLGSPTPQPIGPIHLGWGAFIVRKIRWGVNRRDRPMVHGSCFWPGHWHSFRVGSGGRGHLEKMLGHFWAHGDGRQRPSQVVLAFI